LTDTQLPTKRGWAAKNCGRTASQPVGNFSLVATDVKGYNIERFNATKKDSENVPGQCGLMNRTLTIVLLFVTLFAACATPDTESRYNEFADATADARSVDANTGEGVVIDFSGTFMLSLSTVVDTEKPIYFDTPVVVDVDAQTIDLSFQPLTADVNSAGEARADARDPVGDAITAEDVPYEDDGTWVADLGEVTMVGDANAVTFRDIVATLTLSGRVDSADFFCGTVAGDVTIPLPIPLAGSTFASVRVDDGVFVGIDDAPYACPASEEDDTSDGDADASESTE